MNKKLTCLMLISIFLNIFSMPAYPEKRQDMFKENETKWVDPNALHQGPIKKLNLPDNIIKRIEILQLTFSEVDPTPLDVWIEDFQRDTNPENEILTWEAMAKVYIKYSAQKGSSYEKRKEIFGILVSGSSALIDEP